MAPLKRVYHHVDLLEEGPAGLWRTCSGREAREYIGAARALMCAPLDFEEAMRRATRDWPFSCEHNLTDRSLNRLAWLGHAGTVLATGSPESLTRVAWRSLDQGQQDEANAAAQRVVDDWERSHMAGKNA